MISYAILAHNEHRELNSLLNFLNQHKQDGDEIVIVLDNPTDEIKELVKELPNVYHRELNNNFAEQKNFLNSKCSKEWIFNIDADEIPHLFLMQNIHSLLKQEYDICLIPRINIVNGIELEHLEKWHWQISKSENIKRRRKIVNNNFLELLNNYKLIINKEDDIITYYEPIINWPDYQYRIYKNNENIKWVKPVHEILIGSTKIGQLPLNESYCLYHIKQIQRQEEQNNYYQKIIENGR